MRDKNTCRPRSKKRTVEACSRSQVCCCHEKLGVPDGSERVDKHMTPTSSSGPCRVIFLCCLWAQPRRTLLSLQYWTPLRASMNVPTQVRKFVRGCSSSVISALFYLADLVCCAAGFWMCHSARELSHYEYSYRTVSAMFHVTNRRKLSGPRLQDSEGFLEGRWFLAAE